MKKGRWDDPASCRYLVGRHLVGRHLVGRHLVGRRHVCSHNEGKRNVVNHHGSLAGSDPRGSSRVGVMATGLLEKLPRS